MATEFTDNDKPEVEAFEAPSSAVRDEADGHYLSRKVVQPLRLLEARLSEVQSRWHAVEEQLSHKDRIITELRADLSARAAIIKRLEATLGDSLLARDSADDANAASQAELSHLEAQLLQQSEMLAGYQQKLGTATAQYEVLEQQLDAANAEISTLRADLEAHQETLAANSGSGPAMAAGDMDVEHSVKHLEQYIQDREQDKAVQDARLRDYAESLDELERRLQQQEALLEEREELAATLGIQNSQLHSRCADREATILQLTQKLQRRIDELESARADASSVHATVDDLQATVATQFERIESLEMDLVSRDEMISSLEEALETESRLTAELAHQLEQQARRVAAAEARLTEKIDAARTLEAQLQGLRDRVTGAETQLADRSAKIDSLEGTLASTTKALEAATHNLDRAVADADKLREELREARALTAELEQTVVGSRLDRKVFEAELGAQQLLIAELEQDLEKQQRTVALLDSSVERITTIAASLASLDQQMSFVETPDSVGQPEVVAELTGPYPVLVGGSGVIPLNKPVMTIGRSRKNDIHLQSLFTSRFHARIVARPSGEVVIDDLASRNGVLVNAEKVSRRTLHHEDKIRIGEREFTYLEPDGASDPLAD